MTLVEPVEAVEVVEMINWLNRLNSKRRKMKIDRFEQLECWKEARALTKMVYALVRKSGFRSDYNLRGQATGAALSVMNNIAEGFDSQSNVEFIRFLRYSRRSASEVQNCLYVALDQAYVTDSEFQTTYQQAEKTRKLIDGFLRYLKTHQSRSRG